MISFSPEMFSYILKTNVGKITDFQRYLMTQVESTKEFVENHGLITQSCIGAFYFV